MWLWVLTNMILKGEYIMNSKQQALYKRIRDFNLDNPNATYPFSYKLAWEYQWTGIFTCRVIREYKKFIFLAMVAEHPVSPSTQIDRVWHLHLLYTKSYWDDFCDGVLQRRLHHSPSLGGQKESKKYQNDYMQTVNAYRQYFGEPPSDIWHLPKPRGEEISYQWFDRNQYWLIPKFNILNALFLNWLR